MNPKKKVVESRIAGSDRSGAHSALGRAVSLHLEGKLKEALRELEQAEARGESSPELLSAKGHIQFELEQFEEASLSYGRLLEAEPRNIAATFNLAVCLEKTGKWAPAAEAFQKAWNADKTRHEALVGLGVCDLRLERGPAALECFEKVLAADPARPDTSLTL